MAGIGNEDNEITDIVCFTYNRPNKTEDPLNVYTISEQLNASDIFQ